MMPIVFCASLAPCIRLKPAAETSCSRLNQRSTRPGRNPRKIQKIDVMTPRPTIIPTSGEMTMKMSVLYQPLRMMAAKPALATAAPA
jgi:hypothetical protein